MRLKALIITFVSLFLIEIITVVIIFTSGINLKQDTVAVNEIVKGIEEKWNDLDNMEVPNGISFAVIDTQNELKFSTDAEISKTIHEAIAHRDTILDIAVDGEVVGKVIIYNDAQQIISAYKLDTLITVIVIMCCQLLLIVGYVYYLHRTIFTPFTKMKVFATRVAGGDLDVPLDMDKKNIFGAFTESFDIMRAELKKAREAEALANASKKELVAKLSHDIKTPVASIKAVADVGIVTANDEKTNKNFQIICAKADQINTLVTNLFSATLEDLKQLTVVNDNYPSNDLSTMISTSDYECRAKVSAIPQCLLLFDKLRLQQVLDNIISNSYKYANTDILVNFTRTDKGVVIRIEDFGGGVNSDNGEIMRITEKFVRGSNSKGKDGAGLGLYISKYLVEQMGGELIVENTEKGLAVNILILYS